MSFQVRITEDQFQQWDAKIKGQKKVRGGVDSTRTFARDASRGDGAARSSIISSTQRRGVKQRRSSYVEQAGSSPAPSPKLYDSKWEETYAAELVLRKHAGLIKAYWYHPFSMWLPGKVRYTPDFMIEYPKVPLLFGRNDNHIEIVEVKGWHKNLRAAMVAIRVAAGIFPCFTWKLVKKQKGGGWDETEI